MKYFMALASEVRSQHFFSIIQSYHYGVLPARLCAQLTCSCPSSHHNNHIELTASGIIFIGEEAEAPESQGQGCWISESVPLNHHTFCLPGRGRLCLLLCSCVYMHVSMHMWEQKGSGTAVSFSQLHILTRVGARCS